MREKVEEALRRNWDDLEAHRALADWLVQQGDPRGTLARCQLQLEDETLAPERRQELQQQEQALLAEHQKAWLADLIVKDVPKFIPPGGPGPQFRWQRGWLVGLRYPWLTVEHARQIAQSAELRFLRELEIGNPSNSGRVLKKDLPVFPVKQKFRKIYGPNIYSIYPLAGSPYLGNVRKLTLGRRPASWALAEASYDGGSRARPDATLALLSRMPYLEHLCLAEPMYNADLVELFSLAGPKPVLRDLELYWMLAADVPEMFRCLNSVRRLTLHGMLRGNDRLLGKPDEGFAAPHLPSLESLHVYREGCGDALLTHLTASPVFARLRELSVVSSNLSDAGAQTLIDARPRSALTVLNVSFSVFTPAMLERLRQAYPFLVANNVRTPEEFKQHLRDNLVVMPKPDEPALSVAADVTTTPQIGRLGVQRITIPGLAAGANRIRRLQIHGTTLAALVGDDRHTHSVVWLRLPDGAELRRRDVPVADWAADPALSADLNTVVYAEMNGKWPQFVVETADGARRAIPYPDWTQEGVLVSCVCMSLGSNGGVLRASMHEGALFGWNLRDPDLSLIEKLVEAYPPALAMEHGPIPSQGKEGLVIACQGPVLYFGYPIFDDNSVECGRVPAHAAAFAPNGAQFAVAFVDHRVQVWNAADPLKPTLHARLQVALPRSLAFSPDGATLATAGADGHILFWSGAMAAPRAHREWGIGALGGIAFAPDGLSCVVGGEEGRLVLWDIAD